MGPERKGKKGKRWGVKRKGKRKGMGSGREGKIGMESER